MPFNFDEIRQLLVTIAQTDIAEVTLKSDNFELTVRKGSYGSTQLAAVVPSAPLTAPESIVPAPVPAAAAIPSSSVESQSLVDVVSPMVGTFYRAPAPNEAPFVEVGDSIKLGQTVCIIEAMKLMNEIETEVAGQVVEILLQNGEPVEFGQPLMRIKPI